MSIQQTVKDGVAFLEQTIAELTAERDYLDGRCAEMEKRTKIDISIQCIEKLQHKYEVRIVSNGETLTVHEDQWETNNSKFAKNLSNTLGGVPVSYHYEKIVLCRQDGE